MCETCRCEVSHLFCLPPVLSCRSEFRRENTMNLVPPSSAEECFWLFLMFCESDAKSYCVTTALYTSFRALESQVKRCLHICHHIRLHRLPAHSAHKTKRATEHVVGLLAKLRVSKRTAAFRRTRGNRAQLQKRPLTAAEALNFKDRHLHTCAIKVTSYTNKCRRGMLEQMLDVRLICERKKSRHLR